MPDRADADDAREVAWGIERMNDTHVVVVVVGQKNALGNHRKPGRMLQAVPRTPERRRRTRRGNMKDATVCHSAQARTRTAVP